MSFLLAVAMVVGEVPTVALANEPIPINGNNIEISLSNDGIYNGEELSLVVTYTGSSGSGEIEKKGIKQKSNGTVLTKDVDYQVWSVSPTPIKNAGNYNVAIKGKGNYEGDVNTVVTVVPKELTVTGGL